MPVNMNELLICCDKGSMLIILFHANHGLVQVMEISACVYCCSRIILDQMDKII